jgi:hypothetical protein
MLIWMVAFHVAVERVGEVVGAVDKEGGDFALFQPGARVVEFDPEGGVIGSNGFEFFEPGAVLVEESAAVNWHGSFESGVDG